MLTAPPVVLALLVLAITAVAAVSDLRTGLIPNTLTFGALGVLFVAQLVFNGLQGGAIAALTGLLFASLIPLLLYIARGLGGGDLKLMAACGVGLGPLLGMEAQMIAFSVGCLYAVGKAIYSGMLWQTLRGTTFVLTNAITPLGKRRDLPESVTAPVRFAPFIFVGVLFTVLGHLT
ncbi:MAG TPA: A24 family peptidase [Polyangiales bacterium]|nr:A24 family peptidase [Polyangiales bacterium]